ncbi:MAG: hypothetical protein OYH77_06245 [Pseudomonadota bacterium]|nr:hypothetical protein [Pseudomonadota bacterium]
MKLSRQDFLKLLQQCAVALPAASLLRPQAYSSSNKHDKFLLYIHFGSADGLTTGMIQPQEVVVDGASANFSQVGKWPQGLFWENNTILESSKYFGTAKGGQSINPNVNLHYKDGKLIFNEYSKVLQPIKDHLCMAVGNARSLAHQDAASFQITGNRFGSDSGTWVAKLAQATSASGSANVVFSPKIGSQASVYTQIFSSKGAANDKVALISADSLDEIAAVLSDAEGIPAADGDALRYWDILKKLNSSGGRYQSTRQSANFYIDNLLTGADEFAATSSMRREIEASINMDKCKELLTASSLPNGKVCDIPSYIYTNNTALAMLKDLQLAAGLAISKKAKGMLMSFGEHDAHGGGSSINVPRHASVLYAGVRLLWELIKSHNLQDKVMIIISHDFTRTAYNGRENASNPHSITYRTPSGLQQMQLYPHGNDHLQAMAMLFINANVPAASRIGGIHDNYTAFASDDSSGIPNTAVAPYTSNDLVGTMLMRCFSDLFNNVSSTREFLPDFDQPIAWLLK